MREFVEESCCTWFCSVWKGDEYWFLYAVQIPNWLLPVLLSHPSILCYKIAGSFCRRTLLCPSLFDTVFTATTKERPLWIRHISICIFVLSVGKPCLSQDTRKAVTQSNTPFNNICQHGVTLWCCLQ